MAAVTASLCFTLLFVGVFVFVSADGKNITTVSGQNVTLTCRAPNNITVLEWSRADLEPEYVLVYRDGQFLTDEQHPSFKNRVDLQDRQMKDGDVSVILKNVTIYDTETYKCHVYMEGAQSGELRSSIYLRVVPPEQKTITADPGQDVTLTGRAPNNNIDVVEWSRADLKPEDVFAYRDGQFHPDNQHSSFKNRVYLQDRQMKDGDVSVILKNVTVNDEGAYECYVVQTGTNRKKRAVDPISIITLRVVDPPGPSGGTTEDEEEEDGRKEDGRKEDGRKEDGAPVGLIMGLIVAALLLLLFAAVGLWIYRNSKELKQDPYQPPAAACLKPLRCSQLD